MVRTSTPSQVLMAEYDTSSMPTIENDVFEASTSL